MVSAKRGKDTVDTVNGVLAALADPTRRMLLDALATAGEATATMLADVLPVSRQAVVKHLAVLDRAGLVTNRRHGREVLYSPHSPNLAGTARWMTELARSWDHRLAAIKSIAEGPDDRG